MWCSYIVHRLAYLLTISIDIYYMWYNYIELLHICWLSRPDREPLWANQELWWRMYTNTGQSHRYLDLDDLWNNSSWDGDHWHNEFPQITRWEWWWRRWCHRWANKTDHTYYCQYPLCCTPYKSVFYQPKVWWLKPLLWWGTMEVLAGQDNLLWGISSTGHCLSLSFLHWEHQQEICPHKCCQLWSSPNKISLLPQLKIDYRG